MNDDGSFTAWIMTRYVNCALVTADEARALLGLGSSGEYAPEPWPCLPGEPWGTVTGAWRRPAPVLRARKLTMAELGAR